MTPIAADSAPSNNPYRTYGLAVFGGVIYFLGWAGFGLWPLAFVSLVPFWAALELSGSWRTAVGVGWVYGIVMHVGGYHWLVPFFEVFSGYGSLASTGFFVAFSAFLGAQYAMYGVIYHALRGRGWSVALAAIPPFVAVEWLYPKLFPVFLANSIQQQITLVQIAELGGPLLVSAIVALVNLAIFETLRWWRRLRSAPSTVWALTLASIGLSLLYGTLRIPQVEAEITTAPTLRLGIVQVNMGIFAKRTEAAEGHRRHIEQSLELERGGELDLLVWPESAYIRSLPRTPPISVNQVRQGLKTPILFGGVSLEFDDDERLMFNTVFLMEDDGKVRATYDKTYLLMFGEYLPLGDIFPFLYDLSPNSGRFTAGTHLRPLTLGNWRISTPVCYEDVLPGFTRDMVREAQPHVLINLTNDSWFGDSQEPWIHLVLSQFRAIEHRRYLIRSTNSGISAVVDPLGRIVAKTGVLTRENLRYDVHMLQGDTIYARFGDWPGWLALIATGFMLIRRRGVAR